MEYSFLFFQFGAFIHNLIFHNVLRASKILRTWSIIIFWHVFMGFGAVNFKISFQVNC